MRTKMFDFMDVLFFFQMFPPPVAETSFHTFMFVVKPSSFEVLHIIP